MQRFQDICNGVGNSTSCNCEPSDSTMYVGRFGASASLTQATLDQMTVHVIDFSEQYDDDYDDYMHMGNGNVFRFDFDPNNNYAQICNLYGDPQDTVDCNFECNDGQGGSWC